MATAAERQKFLDAATDQALAEQRAAAEAAEKFDRQRAAETLRRQTLVARVRELTAERERLTARAEGAADTLIAELLAIEEVAHDEGRARQSAGLPARGLDPAPLRARFSRMISAKLSGVVGHATKYGELPVWHGRTRRPKSWIEQERQVLGNGENQ